MFRRKPHGEYRSRLERNKVAEQVNEAQIVESKVGIQQVEGEKQRVKIADDAIAAVNIFKEIEEEDSTKES